MTLEEIKTIIAESKDILQLLQQHPEYQAIEQNEHFTTENELGLADAIQALKEIHHGITKAESHLVVAVIQSQLEPIIN